MFNLENFELILSNLEHDFDAIALSKTSAPTKSSSFLCTYLSHFLIRKPHPPFKALMFDPKYGWIKRTMNLNFSGQKFRMNITLIFLLTPIKDTLERVEIMSS